MDLVTQIDALLPQTQCTRCGYEGCAPYAQAIVQGQAEINQCPPGGQETINALAELLNRSSLELNPAFGTEPQQRLVALIDEEHCIGCTLCIQACPLDAIIGAAKLMHTVILDECSGCELCLPPCPVDCIRMIPAGADNPAHEQWSQEHAQHAKQRYLARQKRLEATPKQSSRRLPAAADPRRTLIAAALARVKQKKALAATKNV